MKKFFAVTLLALLAACQSTPKLEDDVRYVRLAKVVDEHEFTELERNQAKAHAPPRDSTLGFGLSLGIGGGSGGGYGFGGVMLGSGGMLGERRNNHEEPPQIAYGANRFIVQPVDSKERIEVMSYKKYKVGDCVRVLADHPTEFPRFFELKPGEHCE